MDALSLGCVLMTGSRAGLLTLLVLTVMAMAWVGASRLRPRALPWALSILALGALVVLTTPARRVLSLSDPARWVNLQTSTRAWVQDPWQVLVGVGSGRMWPWYAFEARYFWLPWGGQLHTPIGELLTNPHSVFLGVAIELGLLGLVLVAFVLLVPVQALVRLRRTRPSRSHAATGVLLALAATPVAFLFDYYLLKNFAVSFWWWVALFAGSSALARSRATGSG